MKHPCAAPPPDHCKPPATDPRLQNAFATRFNTATWQAHAGLPPHTTNGDEARYADRCGTYTKCVKQASPGKVDPAAYASFRKALDSGSFADFEAIVLGGTRTMNGPMASYAYTLCGSDSSQFGDAPSAANQEVASVVPPAPALASLSYAAELIELYWASLLRDVAFTAYEGNELAKEAAHELSGLSDYAGPRNNSGKVTPALLFRGGFQGETEGPYTSQFLPARRRSARSPSIRRYITCQAGLDYLTRSRPRSDKFKMGLPPASAISKTPSFATSATDAAWVPGHTSTCSFRHTSPPSSYSDHRNASQSRQPLRAVEGAERLRHLRRPRFRRDTGTMAKIALNAVWYQKWPVHLRHRPESGGGWSTSSRAASPSTAHLTRASLNRRPSIAATRSTAHGCSPRRSPRLAGPPCLSHRTRNCRRSLHHHPEVLFRWQAFFPDPQLPTPTVRCSNPGSIQAS